MMTTSGWGGNSRAHLRVHAQPRDIVPRDALEVPALPQLCFVQFRRTLSSKFEAERPPTSLRLSLRLITVTVTATDPTRPHTPPSPSRALTPPSPPPPPRHHRRHHHHHHHQRRSRRRSRRRRRRRRESGHSPRAAPLRARARLSLAGEAPTRVPRRLPVRRARAQQPSAPTRAGSGSAHSQAQAHSHPRSGSGAARAPQGFEFEPVAARLGARRLPRLLRDECRRRRRPRADATSRRSRRWRRRRCSSWPWRW